jgi:hypothetical protein
VRARLIWVVLALVAVGATIAALESVPGRRAQAGGHLAVSRQAGKAPRPGPAASRPGPAVLTSARCTISGTGEYGRPSDGCARAGYLASGTGFRSAQALITVPAARGDEDADAQVYVALDVSTSGSYSFVRAGISPCEHPDPSAGPPPCPGGDTSGWVAYAQAIHNGLAAGTDVEPIPASALGQAVSASVQLGQPGNLVTAKLAVPSAHGVRTFTFSFSYPAAAFTQAQAVADWTMTHTESKGAHPAPGTPGSRSRYVQFRQGAFTTATGQRGTFCGPWTLSAAEAAASPRQPRPGVLAAEPGGLWNDGKGGGAGDAFGVWLGPS